MNNKIKSNVPAPKVLSWNFTGNSLVLVFSLLGKMQTKIVEASHVNWKQVLAAYKAQKFDKILDLIDVGNAITKAFNGTFEVKNGAVYYNNEVVKGYLFDKIIQYMQEGLVYKHLLNFAKLLFANPSERARNELYKFLENRNYTIDSDGYVIGWKGVRQDYYSVTGGTSKILKGTVDSSGRIYNGVGELIEMERKNVDDDATRTCSYGLHIGSRPFASSFHSGGRLMVVKFSPADAVSVTTDANAQKLRVCKYEVIGEETLDRAIQDCSAAKYVKGPKRDANGRFAKA